MRFFKNKFFLITLTVALCLTVFSVVLSLSGSSWFLKDAFSVVSAPFRAVFNFCANGIKGFGEYFTEFDRLLEENQALRKENEELKGYKNDLEAMKEENAWLRDFLDVKNHHTSFTFIDASVTGRSAGAIHQTLTLNKGSLHGIEAGMTVITAQGLVGKISEVGLTSSEVVCITDTSSAVGAMVERSALVGISEGYNEESCRFHYTTGFSDFDDVAEGDIIITSGKGSIYPYGIKLGTVKSVKVNEANRSIIATVEPAVNFESVTRVMIIESFTVEADE